MPRGRGAHDPVDRPSGPHPLVACRVLAIWASPNSPASLDLPPSTIHGLVKSLQEHGLVAKEPGTSRYMLGPALLKLSNVYLDTLDVRARAMRWTAELARRTGCAIRLARPALRRGHRHPSQPPPGRVGADARDRRDDPVPRLGARKGDPRLRPERRGPDPGGRRCAASPERRSSTPRISPCSSRRSSSAGSRTRRTRPCSGSRRSPRRSRIGRGASSRRCRWCCRPASTRPATTCSTICARPRATSPGSWAPRPGRRPSRRAMARSSSRG